MNFRTRESGNGAKPGDEFYRLKILGWQFRVRLPSGQLIWCAVCQCECGEIRVHRVCEVAAGRHVSCGCYRDQLNSQPTREVFEPDERRIKVMCRWFQRKWSESERVWRASGGPLREVFA